MNLVVPPLPSFRNCLLIETRFFDLFPTLSMSDAPYFTGSHYIPVTISTCFYSISIQYPFRSSANTELGITVKSRA